MITHTFQPQFSKFFINSLITNPLRNFKNLNCNIALTYSDVACKCYTQISLLHSQTSYWCFQGLARVPPLRTLTWIRLCYSQSFLLPRPFAYCFYLRYMKCYAFRLGVLSSSELISRLTQRTSINRYPCLVSADHFPHTSAISARYSLALSYSIYNFKKYIRFLRYPSSTTRRYLIQMTYI